jgi:hypothetical protein
MRSVLVFPSYRLAAIVVMTFVPGGMAVTRAQEPAKPSPAIELKIDLVISRTQGEKKISSLPFTLFAASNEQGPRTIVSASVRMGVDVPVGSTTSTREGTPAATTTRPEYRQIGTQIDCTATRMADGRYSVALRIHDSAIFSPASAQPDQVLKLDPAAFKTFTINNTRIVTLGRLEEFGRAADPITGEIVRVEGMVSVVK